jgi:hypothetical protein
MPGTLSGVPGAISGPQQPLTEKTWQKPGLPINVFGGAAYPTSLSDHKGAAAASSALKNKIVLSTRFLHHNLKSIFYLS